MEASLICLALLSGFFAAAFVSSLHDRRLLKQRTLRPLEPAAEPAPPEASAPVKLPNSSLRIRDWDRFHATYTRWGQLEQTDEERMSGEGWFIARLHVARQEVVRSAATIFAHAFARQRATFHHFDRSTLLLLARENSLEDLFHRSRSTMKLLVELEELGPGELNLTAAFVSGGHYCVSSEFMQVLNELAVDESSGLAIAGEQVLNMCAVDSPQSRFAENWEQIAGIDPTENLLEDEQSDEMLERGTVHQTVHQSAPSPAQEVEEVIEVEVVRADEKIDHSISAPISLDRLYERSNLKYGRRREAQANPSSKD